MEQKIFGVIYKITNLINGKVYIGQTIDLKRRMKQHRSAARRSNKSLYKDIQKHGWANFVVVIVTTTTDRNMMNYLEKFFIKAYESRNPKIGYNLTEGGDGTSGRPCSETTKQKLRLANKGKILSEEHKQKLSKAHKGKILSEEHKQNLGLSQKYIPRSEETKQKISDAKHKRSVEQLSPQNTILNKYPSLMSAQRATGVNVGGIYRCCKDNTKTAGGFCWQYAEDK